jgi:hypothetical protein
VLVSVCRILLYGGIDFYNRTMWNLEQQKPNVPVSSQPARPAASGGGKLQFNNNKLYRVQHFHPPQADHYPQDYEKSSSQKNRLSNGLEKDPKPLKTNQNSNVEKTKRISDVSPATYRPLPPIPASESAQNFSVERRGSLKTNMVSWLYRFADRRLPVSTEPSALSHRQAVDRLHIYRIPIWLFISDNSCTVQRESFLGIYVTTSDPRITCAKHEN